VRSRGQAELEAALDRAVPLADYTFSWLEQRYGKTLEGKSQIAGEISRILAKVNNPFEVDLLVRRAVDSLGIREELLRRPAGVAGIRRATVAAAPVVASTGRNDVAERSLVSLMLRFPAVVGEAVKENEIRHWMGPRWGVVVDLILAQWQKRGKVDVMRVAQDLPADLASELTAMALEGERALREEDCAKMAADCLSHLGRKYLRGLERDLRVAIRAAEEQKDEKAKRERILEWQDVVRKERQLDRRKIEPKTTIR